MRAYLDHRHNGIHSRLLVQHINTDGSVELQDLEKLAHTKTDASELNGVYQLFSDFLFLFTVQVLVDGAPVRIQLWDTAGQEDFDCLRSLCYSDTDVFLVCFSVVNPTSFQNITEKWIPEIRTHNPQTPVVLVGTQADLRDDVKVLISLNRYHVKPVPRTQAEGLAEKIRAQTYVECSALTQKNLKEVFDTAIVSAVEFKAQQEKKMTAKGIKTLSKCRWKKFFCFV
ncbi:PREDICTED: rho-related GTP-binding protein RhoV [Thamnophis sirtalis]|uniref:Rho-related GTP-binding protein RhoV n=1 Tax=Thamnophis sirtalis TaxID=35019 RepID=A0A6I9XLP6_9SAUR|nr:PREDICTED: rho-related GTP-binding protein RhoV [Thamnophis sirtalis]